ncbi:MAG: hypothetical protein LQ351_004808 [Letrouitia transgressa]|nr:MAG: hypothetical protein LQ351_004808 [Letrouitia transgressa]
MPFFKKPLAGPGYVILNVLRVCNIIGLLAVVVASFSMLVKTFIVSKFFFFDAVSHVVTAALSSYVARNWPLLSPTHGFVTLGFLMIVTGVSVLGNLNKEATSQKSLGTAYWRIVIASGILVIIFGVANIFVSYLFRQKKLGVTARQVRAHGATASQKLPYPVSMASTPVSGGSLHRTDTNHRPFHLGRSDTLPSSNTSSRTVVADPRRNISAPMNNVRPDQFVKFEEQGEQIGKPSLAHHPAMNGGHF